jgi:hypothetical protein
MLLDPLAIPIATILRPFKISKLQSSQMKARHNERGVIKDLVIKEQFH